MFAKLLHKIINPSEFVGVEVFESEGTTHYYWTHLKLVHQELEVLQEGRSFNIEELASSLPKKAATFLALNTSRVLTKIIDTPNAVATDEALINQAYPDLPSDQFYYEIVRQDKKAIISICKREELDGLVNRIQGHKICVQHWSLGVGVLNSVCKFISEEQLRVSNKTLLVQDHEITEIRAEQDIAAMNITLNGLSISNSALLGLATIINHLNSSPIDTNLDLLNKQAWEDFRHTRIFNLGLKVAVSVLFILLLVNYLVFDFYYKEVQLLSVNTAQQSSTRQMIEITQSRIKEKELRLQRTGNSKATFYIDQLAGTIPKGVVLNELSYQPLEKTIQKSKPITIFENVIVISGETEDTEEFSDWIKSLEAVAFITSVETTGFSYLGGKRSEFTIQIQLYEAKN